MTLKDAPRKQRSPGVGETGWSLSHPQKLGLQRLDDLRQFPPPKQNEEAGPLGAGCVT